MLTLSWTDCRTSWQRWSPVDCDSISHRSSSPSPFSNSSFLFSRSKSDLVRVARPPLRPDCFLVVIIVSACGDEPVTSVLLARISSTIPCKHVLTKAACSVWIVIHCNVFFLTKYSKVIFRSAFVQLTFQHRMRITLKETVFTSVLFSPSM